jgi:thiamine-phosphate pyrophosphorylase
VPALADAYLAGGARFLQVRAKTASGAEFLKMVADVVARAHDMGAIVIVNDRADIARFAGADGVHVGQDDLPPAMARQLLGGQAVVGCSTHTIEQVRAASRMPVDYIAVGPIFGTTSKDTGVSPVGTALVRQARTLLSDAGLDTPIVAIGGITLDRAAAVIGAGATSVAVIADLLSTGDPAARVRAYLSISTRRHKDTENSNF